MNNCSMPCRHIRSSSIARSSSRRLESACAGRPKPCSISCPTGKRGRSQKRISGESLPARSCPTGALREATRARTLRVEVDLSNPDFKLLPGMYLQIEFNLKPKRLVQIPAGALLFRTSGPQVAIVQPDSTVKFTDVRIGIDNGIHLVRRYQESEHNEILTVAKASGAAIIQSNLTTMVGFGALMTSSFAPLVEMGLVTTLGVALALAGGLLLIPAVILLGERRRTATNLPTTIANEG